MLPLVVFLDDGGVMNDNRLRSQQWQGLVGQFFAPILGGTPQTWAEANRILSGHLFAAEALLARLHRAPDYMSFDRTYQLDWLRGMCELVGVPSPPEEEAIELARRAGDWITPRIRAAFPGAVEAIRTLHTWGYTLHTASGEPSTDLDAYLAGMGVRDCFGRLYGPNLIDTFKIGPAYYERLLADAGVTPAEALVVDDSPQAVTWAAQAGARTVLVSGSPHLDIETTFRIGSLAELPALIEHLD